MQHMSATTTLTTAYETLFEGYRNLKSLELLCELRHLINHEHEAENKADIVLRKSIVTELLHERLNPVFFIDTIRSLETVKATESKTREVRATKIKSHV